MILLGGCSNKTTLDQETGSTNIISVAGVLKTTVGWEMGAVGDDEWQSDRADRR